MTNDNTDTCLGVNEGEGERKKIHDTPVKRFTFIISEMSFKFDLGLMGGCF